MPIPYPLRISAWLNRVLRDNYAFDESRMPFEALTEAQQTFQKSLAALEKTDEPLSSEETSAWLLVSASLRESNPLRYFSRSDDSDIQLLNEDVKNLASLVNNLALGAIPKEERQYIPLLQRFFKQLSQVHQR